MKALKLLLLLSLSSPLMASYREVFGPTGEVSQTIIQRIEDGAFIPMNEENRDYKVYLVWVKEGGVIEPPVEQPKVEPVLTTEDKLNNLINTLKTKGLINEEDTTSLSTLKP